MDNGPRRLDLEAVPPSIPTVTPHWRTCLLLKQHFTPKLYQLKANRADCSLGVALAFAAHPHKRNIQLI